MEQVFILSGSKSDAPICEKAVKILKEFGVKVRYEVASAHRQPDKVDELVRTSTADVFICAAGLSAALPGVVAARTIKPVIGLPINISLDGLDSFLSIAQMPPKVPVACVGIDNASNAAYLAIQILAVKDESLQKKLKEFKEKIKE